MTNKSLHGEDEIAMRRVKSYMMAFVCAKRVPYNFYAWRFYTCTPLTINASELRHQRWHRRREEKSDKTVCSKLSITRLKNKT